MTHDVLRLGVALRLLVQEFDGGQLLDRELDRLARDRVANLLGHSRREITNVYLGSTPRKKPQADASHTAAAGVPAKVAAATDVPATEFRDAGLMAGDAVSGEPSVNKPIRQTGAKSIGCDEPRGQAGDQ